MGFVFVFFPCFFLLLLKSLINFGGTRNGTAAVVFLAVCCIGVIVAILVGHYHIIGLMMNGMKKAIRYAAKNQESANW